MKITLLFTFSLLTICSKAQVNTYTFQRETGQPWELIQYPNAVITNHTITDDVVLPTKIKIPFPFTFNGQLQDSLGISENGFVWFGPTPAFEMNAVVYPISDDMPNSVNGIVSAFGGDLHPTTATQLNSGIVGEGQMQMLIVEWKNTSRLETIRANTAPDTISFQIKLYQFMNRVEIGYIHSGLNYDYTTGVQVGLRGANAVDFNARSTENIGTNWKNTTKAESKFATCEVSPTHYPEYGDLFVWLPSPSTGLRETSKAEITIYPNPATDYISIKLPNDEQTLLRLLDVTRKVLMQQVMKEDSQINMQSVERGVYFIQLEKSDRTTLTQKIVLN